MSQFESVAAGLPGPIAAAMCPRGCNSNLHRQRAGPGVRRSGVSEFHSDRQAQGWSQMQMKRVALYGNRIAVGRFRA